MAELATCCKMNCNALAEYEVRTVRPSVHPSECVTFSCLAHIPDLMTDAIVHEVVKMVAPGDATPVYR